MQVKLVFFFFLNFRQNCAVKVTVNVNISQDISIQVALLKNRYVEGVRVLSDMEVLKTKNLFPKVTFHTFR